MYLTARTLYSDSIRCSVSTTEQFAGAAGTGRLYDAGHKMNEQAKG